MLNLLVQSAFDHIYMYFAQYKYWIIIIIIIIIIPFKGKNTEIVRCTTKLVS